MNLHRPLLIILFLIFPLLGWSATVTKVKDQRALINLEGADSAPGDEYYLLDSANKKRAIIRMTQVRRGKAIAQILKGRAQVGYTLQAKAPSVLSTTPEAQNSRTQVASPYTGSGNYLKTVGDSWGVVGEYLMNTMNAKQRISGGNTNSSNMTGSSFGVGAFYDYAYTPSLVGRGLLALEQFSTSGSASFPTGCDNSSCNAEFTYLSLYGIGKYHFTSSHYRPWIGGGIGFLVALSKSSRILNTSMVSTNQTLVLSGGMDIQMSRKNYIPVSLEYSLFPPSDTVKAHMIVLKAGWAWNL